MSTSDDRPPLVGFGQPMKVRHPAMLAVSALLRAAAALVQEALNNSDKPDWQEQLRELHRACLTVSASVEQPLMDHHMPCGTTTDYTDYG